jgi:hypothetical protein
MSKTFVYDRWDVSQTVRVGDQWDSVRDAEGKYVLAEDAINREAVLQAQIRTLEVQLRDARTSLAALETLRPVWAYGEPGPQVTAAALAGIWKDLGVVTQTDAMQTLTKMSERLDWLDCLEAAGVDNWEGMEEAIRIRREED